MLLLYHDDLAAVFKNVQNQVWYVRNSVQTGAIDLIGSFTWPV